MSVEQRRSIVIKDFNSHPTNEMMKSNEENMKKIDECFKNLVYQNNSIIEKHKRDFNEDEFIRQHQQQTKRDNGRGNRGGVNMSRGGQSYGGIDKNRLRNDRGGGGNSRGSRSGGNRNDRRGGGNRN